MVVIPGPAEFWMGSPPKEVGRAGGPEGNDERLHKKRIMHSFAIAAREVTVEQFRCFRKNHNHFKDYSPTPDCPGNSVSWYDAAAYCNWLSYGEGIPEKQWCYEPKKCKDVRDWSPEAYGEGMRLKEKYLSLKGYRLPSEAEWEYACRAGALTSRYYGETEELLGKYAWYTMSAKLQGMLPGSPDRPGVRGNCLKPNDFGLFDMLGNALEWCQDSFTSYPPGTEGNPSEDREDKEDITNTLPRVMRGGSFHLPMSSLRSASRTRFVPSNPINCGGFRVTRTLD
jgi:formylglycine-generating enzyme required for sulfatase activity